MDWRGDAGHVRVTRAGRPVIISRCCMAVVVTAWVALGGGFARADASSREATARTVSIVIVGADAPIRGLLTEMFRRSLSAVGVNPTVSALPWMTPLQVVERETPPGSSALNLWLDFTSPSEVVFYLTEGKNVFVRHFALPHGFDAVTLDLLDVVVTSAVEAALTGQKLGISRDDFQRSLGAPLEPRAPPSAPAPAPAPARPRGASWSLGAAYEAAFVGPGRAAHGPGALLDVESGGWRWGALLLLRLPYQVEGDAASVRLTAAAGRVSLERVLRVASAVAFFAGVGAGADCTRVASDSRANGVAAAAPFWALDSAVRGSLGAETRLGALTVAVSAGLDVGLTAPRYVVTTETEMREAAPIWVPWRYRPYAALRAVFDL